MSVKLIENVNDFNTIIESPQKIIVALFYAEWAEQCTHILDIMNDFAKKSDYDKLQFINIPAEDLSEVSLKYQVEGVPTVLFFKNASTIDRIDGLDIAKLSALCKKLSNSTEDSISVNDKTENLNERLKKLINKSKIMIFMKGDRNTPRCGFSKQLIGILNETGVQYDTFDILTDEDVRQGLKTYSDWPTYPQVYVNGDLIGGLDIIKELVASNELTSTLTG